MFHFVLRELSFRGIKLTTSSGVVNFMTWESRISLSVWLCQTTLLLPGLPQSSAGHCVLHNFVGLLRNDTEPLTSLFPNNRPRYKLTSAGVVIEFPFHFIVHTRNTVFIKNRDKITDKDVVVINLKVIDFYT